LSTATDGTWGKKLPNGSFSGLVGMLDDGKADVAVAGELSDNS